MSTTYKSVNQEESTTSNNSLEGWDSEEGTPSLPSPLTRGAERNKNSVKRSNSDSSGEEPPSKKSLHKDQSLDTENAHSTPNTESGPPDQEVPDHLGDKNTAKNKNDTLSIPSCLLDIINKILTQYLEHLKEVETSIPQILSNQCVKGITEDTINVILSNYILISQIFYNSLTGDLKNLKDSCVIKIAKYPEHLNVLEILLQSVGQNVPDNLQENICLNNRNPHFNEKIQEVSNVIKNLGTNLKEFQSNLKIKESDLKLNDFNKGINTDIFKQKISPLKENHGDKQFAAGFFKKKQDDTFTDLIGPFFPEDNCNIHSEEQIVPDVLKLIITGEIMEYNEFYIYTTNSPCLKRLKPDCKCCMFIIEVLSQLLHEFGIKTYACFSKYYGYVGNKITFTNLLEYLSDQAENSETKKKELGAYDQILNVIQGDILRSYMKKNKNKICQITSKLLQKPFSNVDSTNKSKEFIEKELAKHLENKLRNEQSLDSDKIKSIIEQFRNVFNLWWEKTLKKNSEEAQLIKLINKWAVLLYIEYNKDVSHFPRFVLLDFH